MMDTSAPQLRPPSLCHVEMEHAADGPLACPDSPSQADYESKCPSSPLDVNMIGSPTHKLPFKRLLSECSTAPSVTVETDTAVPPKDKLDELEEYHRIISNPASLREMEKRVPYIDCAKHALFSLRLRKAYFIYCLVCCLLSAVVCASTFFRVTVGAKEGRALHEHQWHLWEIALQIAIGISLCVETLSALWLRGCKSFMRDWWCIFDSVVLVLTLVDWIMLITQFAAMGNDLMAEIDLPLFVLRFVLQPLRLYAALVMVRRVAKMQRGVAEAKFEELPTFEVEASEESRILSPRLMAEIAQHLPVWLQFRQWNLLYSPSAHGTSLRTFYREQDGPNIIAVKDAQGHIFGGFSEEPWRICPKGYQGGVNSFVFTSRSLDASEAVNCVPIRCIDDNAVKNSMHFFHAVGGTDAMLFQADQNMFGISNALVLCDDLTRGSSVPCAPLGSPALASEGSDFIVSEFECWGLRDAEQGSSKEQRKQMAQQKRKQMSWAAESVTTMKMRTYG